MNAYTDFYSTEGTHKIILMDYWHLSSSWTQRSWNSHGRAVSPRMNL